MNAIIHTEPTTTITGQATSSPDPKVTITRRRLVKLTDFLQRHCPQVHLCAVKGDLERLGYLYRRNGVSGSYRAFADYKDHFIVKAPPSKKGGPTSTGKGDIYLSPAGVELITSLYNTHKLTLKRG